MKTSYNIINLKNVDLDPPSRILSAMTDLQSKYMTRYFILHVRSLGEAYSVLLDQRLHSEEHVAALVLQETHSGHSWYVYTRQLLTPSGKPEIRLANKWTDKRGFINKTELFPEQMGNFWGIKLQGVTLDFRPFTDYKKIPGSKVVIPQSSLDVYILNVIAESLNFTYELRMPEDGLWGYQRPDGHWVGVVGDVEFRRANFSLCLSVTEERKRSVEMTRVYYIDPLSFVTAKSRPQPQWKKLITPFSESVWILVLFSILCGTVVYYILYYVQGILENMIIPMSRIILHTYGSFISQSLVFRTIPWITAGQILLGFWFLYSFLITTYYKTSLTASLAVPSRPSTIDSLIDLLNSDLNFGMIDAKGSEFQLFSTSDVQLYQQLFKRMTFYSSSESMGRVAEGSYAYIYFKSNLESIVNTQFTSRNGETNLHISKEEFFPGGYGWAFPKGAPYARKFDALMWRCLQVGLIDKWLKDLNAIYLKEAQDNKTPEEKKKETKKENEDNDAGRTAVINDQARMHRHSVRLVAGNSQGLY
ncbi:unnamed protein product, partial [Meganyctiphanes norvegica]